MTIYKAFALRHGKRVPDETIERNANKGLQQVIETEQKNHAVEKGRSHYDAIRRGVVLAEEAKWPPRSQISAG